MQSNEKELKQRWPWELLPAAASDTQIERTMDGVTQLGAACLFPKQRCLER